MIKTILNNNKYTKEFKESVKFFEKKYIENKKNYEIKVKIEYNDKCDNWHNYFSITWNIMEDWKFYIWWCIHEEIEKHFPEFKKYIKWHLMSSEWPIHYIANTTYWANQGNLEYARGSAIWLDASLEDLKNTSKLKARLPWLIEEFKKDIEGLWFIF